MKTARHLAYAQLAGAVIVALIGIAGGVLMQVELAAPGPRWSMDFYARMLTFHGLTPLALGAAPIGGALGYLAIGRLVSAKRIPLPALAWIGFGVWVIGIACAVAMAAIATTDSGWTLYTPYGLEGSKPPVLIYIAPLLQAIAATIYAVHLGIVVLAHRGEQTPIAAVLVLALGAAGLVGVATSFASIQTAPNSFTIAFALLLATLAIAGPGKASRVLMLIAAGAIALWVVVPNALAALAIAGLWFTLAVIGGFARPAVAFVVFGCAPAIVLHSLAGAFVPDDLHLHDTHFAVGTFHLLMVIVGFAAIACMHTWFERKPNPIVAWIGGAITSAGAFLCVYGALGAGAAGMPRRYWDYDPMYTSLHSVAMWGTWIALAGAVMIAIAWFIGRATDSGSRSSA